jgi:hypothetical protein
MLITILLLLNTKLIPKILVLFWYLIRFIVGFYRNIVQLIYRCVHYLILY